MSPAARVFILVLAGAIAVAPAAAFLAATGRFGSGADILNWALGL